MTIFNNLINTKCCNTPNKTKNYSEPEKQTKVTGESI